MKGIKKVVPVLVVGALSMAGAHASGGGTDVSGVVSDASTVLNSVIAICITAATFFVGLRIAKRVTRG